ncbi:MAG: hypothetical protein JSR18_04730 [Proteobacteria bacterium]|nr:hypothetical protein [Pseudomonadota bacterium]
MLEWAIPGGWLGFGLWTLVVAWVVFGDGAEVIEGWRAAVLSGSLIDALLSPAMLRWVWGLSWLAGLCILLVHGG